MKNRHQIFFYTLLFVLVSHFSTGQTITQKWYQLENTADFLFQPKYQGATSILKINNYERLSPNGMILGQTLKQKINKGEIAIYKDAKAKRPYPKAKVKEILNVLEVDTFVSFNPDTFEETIEVAENETPLFPIERTLYQLTQHWNFNTKKQQLETSIFNIQIGKWEYSDKSKNSNGLDNPMNTNPLFSMKNNASAKPLSLEDEQIVWAKNTYVTFGIKDAATRQALFSDAHLTRNKVVNYNKVLSSSEITDLVTSVDTIRVPKTNIVYVEKGNFKDKIEFFKANIDIYFDTKKNTFYCKILAIAPCVTIDMDNYEPIVSTVFWVVYDEAFLKMNE